MAWNMMSAMVGGRSRSLCAPAGPGSSAARFTSPARQNALLPVVNGCFSLLRITLAILLSGLAFCGCSQKHDAAARPAIELVQAGQDITWADGYVLRVTKREDSSLEGIQIVQTALDGQQKLIVADKGTVSEGADHNSVKITLYEAQVQRGNTQTRAHLMNLVLSR
jgi:hypothetical protein